MSNTQCERKRDLAPSATAVGEGLKREPQVPLVAKTLPVSEWVRCHPSALAEAQASTSSSFRKGPCVWAAASCLVSAPTYLFSLQSQESLRIHPALCTPV